MARLAVVVTILILFFQGKGSHASFIGILAIVQIIWLASSRENRARFVAELKRLWRQLEAFAVANTRIPWRAVFVFAALPTLALALSNGRSMTAGDNLPVMLVASRLLTEGDTELGEWADLGDAPGAACSEDALPYYLLCTEHGVHSAYPIGMLAVALPFSAVSAAVGGSLDDGRARWRLAKWAASWIAACAVGLFVIIALHAVSPRASICSAAILASGSAIFSTVGQGLWTQGGVILAVLICIAVELRTSADSTGATLFRSAFLQGLAIAFAAACRLTAIAVILPLLTWIAIRAPKRALAIALIAAIALAPIALYYGAVYENLLGPQLLMGAGARWSADPLSGLAGILFSPGRGLLVYQPWLLLALTFCIAPVRRSLAGAPFPRGWLCMSLCAVALHLLLVSLWPIWWGGWSWGSRLVAETLPFLALLCLFPLEHAIRTRKGRVVVAVAMLASFAIHLPGVYLETDRWMEDAEAGKIEEKLWDWTDPPFLYPFLGSDAR